MGQVRFDELDENSIKEIKGKVETNAKTLDTFVQDIVKPYCNSLDSYVYFINECLQDGQNPPTDAELEDFCLNLSTRIYFAGGACEQLGIRDDISKEVYKEIYNKRRDEIKGTIADKDAYAELSSQQEQITNICYNRAYKILKSKIDNAQELLASCKKVLSRRIQEMSITLQDRG